MIIIDNAAWHGHPPWYYMYENIQQMFSQPLDGSRMGLVVLRKDTGDIYKITGKEPRYERIGQVVDLASKF